MFIWKRTDSQMEKVIRLILLCGLVSIPSSLEENLAFKGTATQSSEYGLNWLASNAIDGLRYGPGEAAHCSLTAYQSNPWWRLDLQNSYEISTVIISARSDCCTDQTTGAEIRIGDSLDNNGNNNPICAVTSSDTTVSYSCNGTVGRYVNVVMTGRTSHLSLCEVEVYETENVAFKGTVTQSSDYGLNWLAPNAIDGLRYGPTPAAHCSITGYQSNPWWRLDLQNSYEISTVIITARSDCSCAEQITGAEIRIGDSLDNNGNNNPICAVTSSDNTVSYSCNGMVGRYVNVVMTGHTSHLCLCEVEVYGTVLPPKRRTFLRLKLSSSVDAAAVSDKILRQLQFALALHMSDFNVSWTKLPQQELKHKQNTGSCVKYL